MPQQPLSGDWLNLHKDGMDYTVFRPTYPVNIFVDHYMVAKGQLTFSEERLFPSNEVELFFNLGISTKDNYWQMYPILPFNLPYYHEGGISL